MKASEAMATRADAVMGVSAQTGSIVMTRREAEQIMRMINDLRRRNTARAQATKRKRSWPLATRAMALADLSMEADVLVMLQERIGTAFNLGGY